MSSVVLLLWHAASSLHVPSTDTGLPLCCESALPPTPSPKQAGSALTGWVVGYGMDAASGQPQEMEMVRKERWRWCTLFCGSPCDCRHTQEPSGPERFCSLLNYLWVCSLWCETGLFSLLFSPRAALRLLHCAVKTQPEAVRTVVRHQGSFLFHPSCGSLSAQSHQTDFREILVWF